MTKKKVRLYEEMSEDELIYELLWKKHKAIDPYKLISAETLPTGAFVVKIGGEKMSEIELANLQNEAKVIQNTRYWKIAIETLTAAAQDSIFKSSKNIEDIHYGKALLFNISVMENLFNIIKRPNLNRSPQELTRERYAKTTHPTRSTL